ncbi:MAG: HAD-IA family hydrolase [Lachnospiraceae bacterium]|nr:HAD-IA family hydrolase [Lachnospiraceae bacterium]
MYNTVVFDLDGTLLNTLEDLKNSTNYVMREFDFPERTLDEVRRFVGNGIMKLIQRAVPDGTNDDTVKNAFDCFMEHYDKHCMDNTKPYDGICALMDELKAKNVKMAIVSNKMDEAVKELNDVFFKEYIDVAIGECKGVRRKPAPDSVNRAISELGSDKAHTLYVGDSDVDIATAKNAGIDVVSVLWGFRDKDFLIANGGTRFIDKPSELVRYL